MWSIKETTIYWSPLTHTLHYPACASVHIHTLLQYTCVCVPCYIYIHIHTVCVCALLLHIHTEFAVIHTAEPTQHSLPSIPHQIRTNSLLNHHLSSQRLSREDGKRPYYQLVPAVFKEITLQGYLPSECEGTPYTAGNMHGRG